MLPDLLVPDGNGLIPLYSAAQWIALEGGFGSAFDPSGTGSEEIWKSAFDELCDAIRRKKVRAEGRLGGVRRKLPPRLIDRRFVSYPFRDIDLDLFEGQQMFLHSYCYDDDDDWNSGLTDTLWLYREPIWTHIEVREVDVRERWPMEGWGYVSKPAGRPPKRRVPIFAELDKLRAIGVSIDRSIVLAKRVMTTLNANVFEDDPVGLRVVQQTIVDYLESHSDSPN